MRRVLDFALLALGLGLALQMLGAEDAPPWRSFIPATGALFFICLVARNFSDGTASFGVGVNASRSRHALGFWMIQSFFIGLAVACLAPYLVR